MIPTPAVQHYKRVQRLQAVATLAARRAWRSVDPDFISESWGEALPGLEATVTRAQLGAATLGASYGADTLAAQGLYEAPEGWVNPQGFAGRSAQGAPLGAALFGTAPYVKNLIAGGMSTGAAMASGAKHAGMMAQTQVADAGRGAAGLDTFTRPRVAYVRMLNPPSCSRCSLLAGRIYYNNEGFLRHPRCDCIHVPTSTAAAKAEGLVHDPYEYFQSLSEAEQDKIYTKAGAQAIRDGSDIFQVVNSRRGMKPGGLTTAEGTTKRGYYGSRTGGFEKRAGSKYMRASRARLTPEAIYAQNLPRERTLELLRTNGYLLRQGQVPEGAIRGLGPVTPRDKLTAAQRRLQDARLQWEAAQRGDNPFGKGPITPEVMATAENNYRRWLLSGGEIFTR